MHTLHILPKDLHICKLPAVNVVDVKMQKRSDGWKVEAVGFYFSLTNRPIKSSTLHAS